MTAKQWRLLEAIEDHDRCGTMEVLMEMEYAPENEDDEASRERAWNLTKFVVGGMVSTLVKKGLATNDADGYGITARGRELIATLPRNPERTVALRKLLESKDAAVRAKIAKE